MSVSRAPARDTSETASPRERIRSHMKMVISQLEGILIELKDVAKELREVVGQIDKLTSDIDFDLDPDDWTVATASSTSSSERGLGEAFRLDFLNADVLSDSWEFCSYLEATAGASACATARRLAEPFARSDTLGNRGTIPTQTQTPTPPPSTASVYSQMNGGLPIPNGPRIITPDSSSEEASSSTTYSHKTSRNSGTRERVRFSDKILYHALCCDDDEEEEDPEDLAEDKSGCGTPDSDPGDPVDGLSSSVQSTPKRSSSEHSLLTVHNCLDPCYGSKGLSGAHTLPRKGLLNPASCRKKLLRNSSTQTVSDKSTQTVLPYIPTKQKTKDH